MASLLDVYFAPTHHRNEDWAYIQLLQPVAVRMMAVDTTKIDRLLQEAPNTEVWLRNWLLDDNNQQRHQEMLADPKSSARRHVVDWLRWLDELEEEAQRRGHQFPPRERILISSINEPNSYEHGEQIRDYTAEWLERCTAAGLRATGFNFSVGNPGLAEYNDRFTWEYFAEIADVFLAGDHVVNVHEYCREGGPDYGEDWGNLMGRHARAASTALAQVPWYIGEWGVEGHIYGEHPAGSGWKYHKFDISPDTYASWLKSYGERVQPYVKGIFPFLLDYANNQWATLDIHDAMREFLDTAPHIPVKDEPAPPPPDRLVWPVEGRITQNFNENPQRYPRHPGHMGLDIGAPHGKPVQCMANGVVAWVDFDTGYGNYVRVWHEALGVHSFYAHLSETDVTKGAVIAAGDELGKVGTTGISDGPHLHWEVRLANADGTYQDPGNGHANGRVDPLTAWHIWQR